MKNRIAGIIWVLSIIFFVQCKDECSVQGNCTLEPNPGPCLAYVPRYYYDQQEKKCKEFIWGGCAGVVPFETLQACENGCGCK